MLIHFSTYININQNAMNDVTSIYLVRDMHKTVTIFLCMNLKKNHTALCILQKKERKKRLVLGGPLRFSLTFQPYSQGSQPGGHCITNTSFLLQDRRKLCHEPISKVGRLGLGLIPKPKPKLADTFDRYRNRYKNHISKGESSYQ